MCGFFGEFGPGTEQSPSVIGAISAAIQHRGPDDVGNAAGEGWMLGFRRLSIIDLSAAGHQPLDSSNGRHVIVFNGEVYNFVELKQELMAQGEVFSSGTDTEVVLKLVAREGSGALAKLNGMFAFVVVDLVARRFLMARDRLGVKPFYYRADGGRLRFASELKALLAWPDADTRVDRGALLEFMALGYLPNDESIFEGYAKLPAAHYAEGDLDMPSVEPRRYWSVTIAPRQEADDRASLEELTALIADAVKLRMRSDAPVAMLLSGGIDSALVASFVAAGGDAPLALTAGFGGTELDETLLARATADHLGIDLRELPMQSGNLADVDRLAETFDEPFADASAIPMMRICEAARRHATVLLTGDGGDEAFAGYRRYIEAQRYRYLMAIPSGPKSLAWGLGRGNLPLRTEYKLAKASLAGDLMAPVFDGLGLVRDPAVMQVLPPDLAGRAGDVAQAVRRIWSSDTGRDLLSRQRQFDYGIYLPDDVLVKADRASMAHSTEIRSPFLDYRVVEFAATLPNRLLLDDGKGKIILRHLADRRLPKKVAAAKKKGFGVPLGDWLRAPAGQQLVRERLIGGNMAGADYWRPEGVERLLSAHLDGTRDMGEILWRLLVLEAWTRRYLPSGTRAAAPQLAGGDLA